MPFSQSLADRLRQAFGPGRGLVEKKMFGGLCFMLEGHMLVGIWKASLIVRVGPDQAAEALKQEHVREFDLTRRPMTGWVLVDPDGLDTDEQLNAWIEKAMRFVETLPRK